ncbi:MAG: xylose isomerase, partial [Sulfitobacter sp.]|nr:xylose isomerase [Sulfitobacter sp.]
DTDQFPNNIPEMALAYYEVLRAGGFTTGGTNFDAKLRRQSLDAEDLILAHVGGMDACAAGLKAAAAMLQDGKLEAARDARYAGWAAPEGQDLLASDLASIEAQVRRKDINPAPRSGRQERLENLVNRYL